MADNQLAPPRPKGLYSGTEFIGETLLETTHAIQTTDNGIEDLVRIDKTQREGRPPSTPVPSAKSEPTVNDESPTESESVKTENAPYMTLSLKPQPPSKTRSEASTQQMSSDKDIPGFEETTTTTTNVTTPEVQKKRSSVQAIPTEPQEEPLNTHMEMAQRATGVQLKDQKPQDDLQKKKKKRKKIVVIVVIVVVVLIAASIAVAVVLTKKKDGKTNIASPHVSNTTSERTVKTTKETVHRSTKFRAPDTKRTITTQKASTLPRSEIKTLTTSTTTGFISTTTVSTKKSKTASTIIQKATSSPKTTTTTTISATPKRTSATTSKTTTSTTTTTTSTTKSTTTDETTSSIGDSSATTSSIQRQEVS